MSSRKKISLRKMLFLRDIVRNLSRSFKPNQVLLFGSHAYGKPSRDSDIDLLIIKNTRLTFAERARRVSRVIGRHLFPLDLIVLTPSEVQKRLDSFDPFLEEALTQGKILYDKNGCSKNMDIPIHLK